MKINTTYFKLKERHFYGSSRVGVRNSDLDVLPFLDKNFSMKSVHYSIGSRTNGVQISESKSKNYSNPVIHNMRYITILFIIITLNLTYSQEFKEFYENGNLKGSGFLVDGLIQGKFSYYYENGMLRGTYYYEKGKKQGIHIGYYENGNLYYYCTYENDVVLGPEVFYYKNGNIQLVQSKDMCGEIDGPKIEYYENGTLCTISNFEKGKEVGEFKKYYESGQLELKCFLNNDGKLEGDWEKFDEFGELIEQRKYLNGELVK